jgi:hypothetical protein
MSNTLAEVAFRCGSAALTTLCLPAWARTPILRRMRFQACRGFIAVVTAVLFTLSAAGQNIAASAMVTHAGMTVAASEAASEDHCPPSDCSKQMDQRMACFAHCATVLGILSASNLISVSVVTDKLEVPQTRRLANLHGPPEPPPPKSVIVI